jgi:hypothetical protein
MDTLERSELRARVETLDAEVDALRLLVLCLMGQMAIDDAEQIKAVVRMLEEAGHAMHSVEPRSERHWIVAREIDSISQLLHHILRASRQH